MQEVQKTELVFCGVRSGPVPEFTIGFSEVKVMEKASALNHARKFFIIDAREQTTVRSNILTNTK
jgi:hypothetical protein